MAVEVTARHMEDSSKVQRHAGHKAEELAEEFQGIEHVHVVLDVQKHNNIASVAVQARRHVRAEAAETSDNMFTSIDLAVEKVARQLRRRLDKIQDHKPAMKHTELDKEKEPFEEE